MINNLDIYFVGNTIRLGLFDVAEPADLAKFAALIDEAVNRYRDTGVGSCVDLRGPGPGAGRFFINRNFLGYHVR